MGIFRGPIEGRGCTVGFSILVFFTACALVGVVVALLVGTERILLISVISLLRDP